MRATQMSFISYFEQSLRAWIISVGRMSISRYSFLAVPSFLQNHLSCFRRGELQISHVRDAFLKHLGGLLDCPAMPFTYSRDASRHRGLGRNSGGGPASSSVG